jgi:[acyl-carrier-protein] S-malonyltransferase
VNQQGRGILGISSFLSPNSLIMIGQGDTLDRFKSLADRALPMRVSLRKNDHRWPPFHTPIVRLRNIPSRASVLMNTLPNGRVAPKPAVFSLVTGKFSYNDYNARDILYEWTDHPQRLWDAVYETLSMGIDLVIHVGPEPNIIPATYRRLRENIEAQTRGSIGMRALSAVVRRPWISSLLPERAALLRAPLIAHLILEDWLLQQPP